MKIPLILISLLLKLIKPKLNIHLIPHTHQDPGWILSFSEFYTQRVHFIYDNMLKKLIQSQERTFIICEVVNFEKWYNQDIDESKRQIIRDLVKEGRIEFAGGGQVMNDEANPYYQEIINNMRSGLQFIKSEFGKDVLVGWQLDPFGHSLSNAYIFSKLGFKYLVMERIDFQDTMTRIYNSNLEFFWKPLKNKNNMIFTHIIPIHYGLNFYYPWLVEKSFQNNTKYDNYTYNLIKVINQTRSGFKHDNYLFFLGDDFTYMPEEFIFEKIEGIINYTKTNKINGEEINMFYSTPSRYFEEVLKENVNFRIEEQNEFFPFAERPFTYWTGYFSSRPYLKGLIRKFSNSYMVFARLLVELRLNYLNEVPLLTDEFKLIGFLIHHDTITGTSKEYVNLDFINMIKKNQTHSYNVVTESLNNVFQNSFKLNKIVFNNEIVEQNISIIYEFKENSSNQAILGLYNPGINGKLLINLEFIKENNNLEIFDNSGNKIISDFFCFNIKDFNYSNKCILSFIWNFSQNIMLYSFKLIKTNNPLPNILEINNDNIEVLNNIGRYKSITFNKKNASFNIEYFQNNNIEKYNFSIWYGIYNTHFNNQTEQKSKTRPKESNPDGAYIFTPIEEFPNKNNIIFQNSKIIKGNISTSFIFRFENLCYSIITFYHEPSFVKIDTIFDEDKKRGESKSYSMVLESDIENEVRINDRIEPEIFTDSNGLRMIRRIKNYQKEFESVHNETVSNNFYPVTSMMSMRDKNNFDRKITLFNDRPQSGGVLKKGQFILLLNRKSTVDDWKGLCEPLYEKQSFETYFKLTHFIMFGNTIFEKNTMNYNYNFIFNYFHNTPFFFNDISGIESQFDNVHSQLSECILVSENIREQYQIVHNKLIIGQYYVYYDDYFMNKKTENIGFVSLRFSNKKISIKIDNNGITFNDNVIKKIMGNQNFDIKIRENDLVFIYYYFDE